LKSIRLTVAGRARVVWLAAAAMALSGLAFSCSKSSEQSRGGSKPVPVTVATVATASVPVEITTFGTVAADSSVAVRSQVNGAITKVHFKKGQNVRAGDLLFTIDPRPFKAAVDGAQAALDRDNALAENARKGVLREQSLFKKGISAEESLDKAAADAESLEAAARADAAMLERARLDLENCSIRSPVDGRVGNVLVDEGNLVKANDATLVTVNKISPAMVFFSIPQSELPAVQKFSPEKEASPQTQSTQSTQTTQGSPKGLTVIAYPQGSRNSESELVTGQADEEAEAETGELVFVDNAIDKSTGTVQLGASFENQDERLWPGQYLMVKLTLTMRKDAIIVPSRAVETGRDGKYVFVVKPDNTAEIREVMLAPGFAQKPGQEDVIVIAKGLRPGEQVVTDGQLRLGPGAKVEIKK
jgi:multidrug efflux system membrane fusion protein